MGFGVFFEIVSEKKLDFQIDVMVIIVNKSLYTCSDIPIHVYHLCSVIGNLLSTYPKMKIELNIISKLNKKYCLEYGFYAFKGFAHIL